jgi:hypothetical protein
MARTFSKPTIRVRARSRESMELEWKAEEEPTQPASKTRQRVRPKLISVSEEVVLVSENDPRRE